MAEYALQPVGHDPYAQALEPVVHDPWFGPHAHEPLIVPVQARPSTAPAPVAPDMAPERSPNLQPAAAGSGNDLGGLVDTWFPPRPAGSPFNVPDALATPTAQRAAERLSAAPLQVGSPGADDAFLQHQPGQPFWPYAQSPQDMSFQQALQAAGGGPEFPAMPAPPAPPVMPTWQDPATVESTVGPQPQDWQKGLGASLASIAKPGTGGADIARSIPSLIDLTGVGSAATALQSLGQHDWSGAGLAALGALPGVKAAGKVAKVGEEAVAGLARRLEAKGLPAVTPSLTASLGEGGAATPRLVREPAFTPTFGAPAQSLDDQRISTRVPWNKVEDPANPGGPTIENPIAHTDPSLVVGHESSQASYGGKPHLDAYTKNAEMLRDLAASAPGQVAAIQKKIDAGKALTDADVVHYPGLALSKLRNAKSISEAFIQHIKNNVLALHDAVPDEIKQQSKRWYDGANAIAHRWGGEFGVHARNVAGAIAALSPQTDWFQNVSRARRLLEIDRDQADKTMTPEMVKWLQDYIDKKGAPKRKKGVLVEATPNDLKTAALWQKYLDGMRDTKLKDIEDPYARALWSRAYDEKHFDRSYPILHPEGHEVGTATTAKGNAEKMGWGSFAEIANAIRAIKAPGLEEISQAMGGNHKVRNFYNNIIAPNAQHGDVTIDTHAIAAGLLRALSSSHLEVEHGLGLKGSGHAASGSLGLYGLFAEAYRQAAKDRGILPREMQSITWEALRGLFSPSQKDDKALAAAVNTIWTGVQHGHHDLSRALELISERAGHVDVPSWFKPGSGSDVAAWNAADQGAIPKYGLSRRAGGAGGRAGDVNPTLLAGPARDLSTEEQRQIADEVLQAKEEPK
jgi:hypothetical protein